MVKSTMWCLACLLVSSLVSSCMENNVGIILCVALEPALEFIF